MTPQEIDKLRNLIARKQELEAQLEALTQHVDRVKAIARELATIDLQLNRITN